MLKRTRPRFSFLDRVRGARCFDVCQTQDASQVDTKPSKTPAKSVSRSDLCPCPSEKLSDVGYKSHASRQVLEIRQNSNTQKTWAKKIGSFVQVDFVGCAFAFPKLRWAFSQARWKASLRSTQTGHRGWRSRFWHICGFDSGSLDKDVVGFFFFRFFSKTKESFHYSISLETFVHWILNSNLMYWGYDWALRKDLEKSYLEMRLVDALTNKDMDEIMQRIQALKGDPGDPGDPTETNCWTRLFGVGVGKTTYQSEDLRIAGKESRWKSHVLELYSLRV